MNAEQAPGDEGEPAAAGPAGNAPEKCIRLPIAVLVPDPANPRTMPDEARAGLGVSLETFGALDIVLNETTGELVSGHQRLEALKAAGAVDLVRTDDWGFITHPKTGERFPVRFVRWDEVKQRMANLAANNPHLQGDFTEAALDQLRSLEQEAEFCALGLDKLVAQLESELEVPEEATEGNCDPDEVPEPPAEPITRPGDLWLLGDHRLLCGDSTKAADVARLLGSESPHLMVTDPPYGVAYDPEWRAEAGMTVNAKKLGKVANDDRCDWRAAWAHFHGDVAYVWHAGLHAAEVQASLESVGFRIRSQIIWVKDRFALSRGDYHWHHEPAWYAVREGSTGHWNGDRSQSTRWEIPAREDDGHGHGTQKPVECMARPMRNNSQRGDAVYEPFSGSGTTIIAGEMLGRRVLAMELEPVYVDVAVARWEQFTGRKAVRSEGANG